MVIPDLQVTPDLPERHLQHLDWIGEYIVDRRPDVLVHLGDHWDMNSLSTWSSKKEMEGKRYRADIEAGNYAMERLLAPLNRLNERQRLNKKTIWRPEMHFTVGNHEHRVSRAVEADPKLESLIGIHDMALDEWQVHPFLEPVDIDGVLYAHYFYNPMSGRPYGGMASTRLKQVGCSFTMGHQQTLDYALRFVNGQSQHALVAGAGYLHDEDYKGPQGNAHWRGIIVKHDVYNGSYDPMFVSLDYLERRYGTGSTRH